MTVLSDAIDVAADEVVAEYLAGGLEPDGIALSLGVRTDDLGYGTDLWCRDDCEANMSEVDRNSPEAVANDMYRLLSTPQGRILNDPEAIVAVGEDPNYGYGLISMLNVGSTDVDLRAHADLAAAQCRQDDRVKWCNLTVTRRGGNEFDVLLEFELKAGGVYSRILQLTSASDLTDEVFP